MKENGYGIRQVDLAPNLLGLVKGQTFGVTAKHQILNDCYVGVISYVRLEELPEFMLVVVDNGPHHARLKCSCSYFGAKRGVIAARDPNPHWRFGRKAHDDSDKADATASGIIKF